MNTENNIKNNFYTCMHPQNDEGKLSFIESLFLLAGNNDG